MTVEGWSRRLALILVLLLGAGCRRHASTQRTPPEPPTLSPGYRDVAREAGLRFSWKHHLQRIWTNRDAFGAGCALLDYDRDGHPDIFLAGDRRCALFRNQGDGTFQDVSQAAGVVREGSWHGIAEGDYDNDGFPDLYVTGFHAGMLLHNERGRGFVDRMKAAGLTETQWGSCTAFLDADNDGKLDLLVGHYVLTGEPYPVYCAGPHGVLSGCRPQVYPAQFPRLYRNLGNGRFSDVTLVSGLGMAHGKALALQLADYDNDGKSDLYVANDGMPGDLFHNLGHGRFENVAVPLGAAYGMAGEAQAGMGVDFADYDRDGRLDLVVTTFQDETFSLYHNDGAVFSPASFRAGLKGTSEFLGFGTKFLDYDNDGWPDLTFANGHVYDNADANRPGAKFRQPLLLFHNRSGRFERVADPGPGFESPILGRGLAVGDIRNNGSQDLLVVDYDGEPLLLERPAPAENRWLGVELRGVRCNRDGIGARVTVTARDGGHWFRDCTTAGSYLSAMDARTHFGLGQAAGPLTVEVRWPDGRTSRQENVPADRYIRMVEPG